MVTMNCPNRVPPRKACDPENGCQGWAVFDTGRGPEIQRCDECEVYEYDEDVREHINNCAPCRARLAIEAEREETTAEALLKGPEGTEE